MVHRYQNMDDDDDLEALRLAALQTIRPRVLKDKPAHTDSAGFFRPSNNPNLITIVPLEIKNKQVIDDDKKCFKKDLKLGSVKAVEEKKLPPKVPTQLNKEEQVETKFSRFRDSDSDSDDYNTGRNVTFSDVNNGKVNRSLGEDKGHTEEKKERLNDDDDDDEANDDDDDDDSLEKLMDQMEKEFRTDQSVAVSKKEEKKCTQPRLRSISPSSKKVIRVQSPLPYRGSPRRSTSPRRRRSLSPKRRIPQRWTSRKKRSSPLSHERRRKRSASPPNKKIAIGGRDQSPTRRNSQPPLSRKRRSLSPPTKKTAGGASPRFRDQPLSRKSSPQPISRRKRSLSPVVKKVVRGTSPGLRDQSKWKGSGSPPLKITSSRYRDQRRKSPSTFHWANSASNSPECIRNPLSPNMSHSASYNSRSPSYAAEPSSSGYYHCSPTYTPTSPAYIPVSPSFRPATPDYGSASPSYHFYSPLLESSPKCGRVPSSPKQRKAAPFPKTPGISKIRQRRLSSELVKRSSVGKEGTNRRQLQKSKTSSRKHGDDSQTVKNGKRKEERKASESQTQLDKPPNPILEARRKKFESNSIVAPINKKIRLGPIINRTSSEAVQGVSKTLIDTKNKSTSDKNLKNASPEPLVKSNQQENFVDYSSADVLLLDADYNLDDLDDDIHTPASKATDASAVLPQQVERTRKLDVRNLAAPARKRVSRKRPSNEESPLVQKKKISVNIKPTALKVLEERSKKISEHKFSIQKAARGTNDAVAPLLPSKKISVEKSLLAPFVSKNMSVPQEDEETKRRLALPGRLKSVKASKEEAENNKQLDDVALGDAKGTGVDLRTELSRRRAERLKGGPKLVPITRLLQSAFDGVVGNNKLARTNRPSSPEGAVGVHKQSVSISKGRRVQVVQRESPQCAVESGSQESDTEFSDENVGDTQHSSCSHLNTLSGRSILHRNQV